MISPHTPPGTKVVCVDASNVLELQEGGVYTVQAITRGGTSSKGRQSFGVHIWEARAPFPYAAYCPTRFRLADLPRCLTELLEPVNLPREALV